MINKRSGFNREKFISAMTNVSLEVIDGDNFSLRQTFIIERLEAAMADEEDELPETELSYDQRKEIAKWFLLNAPAGEINYVAKGT